MPAIGACQKCFAIMAVLAQVQDARPWQMKDLACCRVGVIDPSRIYDLMGEILSALNRFSLGLCAFLYVKVKSSPGADAAAASTPTLSTTHA